MSLLRQRPGTTLVELLIFLAVLSLVVASALPLLFSATESRILQQTVSVVEQNGTQVLQNVTLRIRNAERILLPALGETGSVLVLQTASGATNPTIIGLSSGAIVMIESSTRQDVSTNQVAVQNFTVRNTSTSSTDQSVLITFRVSRTIRLQQPHSYAQNFETVVGLFPDDETSGGNCGCVPPVCNDNDMFSWSVCQEGECFSAGPTHLQCP